MHPLIDMAPQTTSSLNNNSQGKQYFYNLLYLGHFSTEAQSKNTPPC